MKIKNEKDTSNYTLKKTLKPKQSLKTNINKASYNFSFNCY